MEELVAENFIFYRSYYDCLKEFSDQERLEILDAMLDFAFANQDTEFHGMQNAVFSMMKPLIESSIKNYKNGKKGGRPQKQTKTTAQPQTDVECKFAPDSIEVESFIKDFKIYKNADFEPTTAERKNIAIVLSELDGYNFDYWQKVFISAKGGYLINGQAVPCNLRKILLEHNSIYAGEANLAPNKEHIEQLQEEKTARKKAVEEEYARQSEIERKEREEERAKVQTADDAIEFLNKHLGGANIQIKRISSDFKEFEKLFNIGIDQEGSFYEKC